VRGLFRRIAASRRFWQGLTVLGAVLLGLVGWVALSPDAPRSLGALLQSEFGASTTAPHAVTPVFVPPPPAAAVAEVKTESVDANAQARARVRIVPGGRVWIDEQLRGEAPLEVALSPGAHVIAAGRDVPIESRNVELHPGDNEIAFDLEGK
jgi:hypothetical protein